MTYICSKPASYFVSKGNKFARLGYEEGHHDHHCTCAIPVSTSQAGTATMPLGKRKKPESPQPLAPQTPPYNSVYSYAAPVLRPGIPQEMKIPSLPVQFVTHYPNNFAASCSPSTIDFFSNEGVYPLYQLETESQVLSQEFTKHSAELGIFCQKLTSEWICSRSAASMDSETAKNWSYLCTQGMALQHMVKSMAEMHAKFVELVALHKMKRQLLTLQQTNATIRAQQPVQEVMPRYLP